MTIPHATIPRGRGELILLAEDEDLVRRAAVRILERSGYAVVAAEDGILAMELFATHGADIRLLITDVVMPRMGGRRLVEHVRGLRPSMPVLCTSGYAEQASDIEKTLPDHVPFIHKPWRSADLLVQVRDLLDNAAIG